MDSKKFIAATGFWGLGTALNIPAKLFALQQSQTIMPKVMKIIAIEEHFTIRSISQKVMEFNAKQTGGVVPTGKVMKEFMNIVLPNIQDIEDVGEHRLKYMDESGIDMQVLSYGNGSPQNITDKSLAIELCKEANNALGNMIKQYPAKFAGFAILPLDDPNAAAEELEISVNQLGLKGAMLSGNFNGRFFDNDEFLPIFAKAEALDVPLYMHPATIPKNISDYYYQSDKWSAVANVMFATAGYGWHLDSGIVVLRLIVSGIFDKHPNLKLISGHWGELVPFFLNRLDDQLGKTLHLKRKISDYYRSNVYITPSGLFSEPQLQFAIAEMGADHIIYSGDYPFLQDKNSKVFLVNAKISKAEKERIGYKNAEKLLGL